MNLVTPDLSVPAAVREATDSSASGAESVELNTSTPAVDAEHRNSPGSVSGCTPVSRAERAEWTVERRPRKGRLLPLAPPAAQSSPPAARGPAWLVTLVDFIERATSRTTSLWQHLTMFFSYCLVIAGLPIFAVAWVVTRFVAVGSWPGMSSIAAVAAAGGLTIIMRRGQRGQPGGASESHQDSPDLADGRAENNPPAAGEDEAGRETPDA